MNVELDQTNNLTSTTWTLLRDIYLYINLTMKLIIISYGRFLSDSGHAIFSMF